MSGNDKRIDESKSSVRSGADSSNFLLSDLKTIFQQALST